MFKNTSPNPKESSPISSLENSKIINTFRIVNSGSATLINPEMNKTTSKKTNIAKNMTRSAPISPNLLTNKYFQGMAS